VSVTQDEVVAQLPAGREVEARQRDERPAVQRLQLYGSRHLER
jgi:hypothetical protein